MMPATDMTSGSRVGYMTNELETGVYSVLYKSTAFTIGTSYENYWIMFDRKATELCGTEG
jgi:hypothetical protein